MPHLHRCAEGLEPHAAQQARQSSDGQMAGLLGWLVSCLVRWLVSCLLGWLLSWLDSWLDGLLVGWLAGWWIIRVWSTTPSIGTH